MSILLGVCLMTITGLQPAPELVWRFEAEGPLSAEPIVVPTDTAPGPLTVFVDSATGSVVALDGKGALRWSHDGAFFNETLSTPAFTTAIRNEQPLLLFQDDDHQLVALEVESGRVAWTSQDFPFGPAMLHWADLDDDRIDEVVVLHPEEGIMALDGEGRMVWEVRPDDLRGEGPLGMTLAIGDSNGDYFGEIVGSRGEWLFLLDSTGFPVWEEQMPGPVAAGPIALLPTFDAPGKIVAATADALLVLDADTGQIAREHPLPNGVAPGALAVSLRWPGGPRGIITGNKDGGASHWGIEDDAASWADAGPETPLQTLLSGDWNGDGFVDFVGLDEEARVWLGGRHEGASSWQPWGESFGGLDRGHAALFLREEQPGAHILVSRGQALQVYRLGGNAHPDLFPWPGKGGNPGRRNAYRTPETLADIEWVEKEHNLVLPEGAGFEAQGAQYQLPELPLPEHVYLVEGTLPALPEEGVWQMTVSLQGIPLASVDRPGGEDFVLQVPAGHSITFGVAGLEAPPENLDGIELRAKTRTLPRAGLFHNRVGFEANGTKHFTAWTNFPARSARFRVLDASGQEVFSNSFLQGERITGPYGQDWGAFYWRGDFTELLMEGSFRIVAKFDEVEVSSAVFPVEGDLLWNRSFELALRPFGSHRCGAEGALDCGDGNNWPWRQGSALAPLDPVPTVFALAEAFGICLWRFSEHGELNPFGQAFREEILHGADWLVAQELEEAATMEAYAAALAKASRVGGQNRTALRDRAIEVTEGLFASETPGPQAYGAAMDLFILLGEERFSQWVEQHYPGPNLLAIESVVDYEIQIDEMSMSSMELMLFLEAEARKRVALAQNPFGVYVAEAGATANYFGTPDGDSENAMPQGRSREILEAALIVAQAARFQPKAEYRAFVYDQFNWLLGNNPLGLCLIAGLEGEGPGVARWHREDLTEGWEGMPGLIAHGITGTAPGDDRPYFDGRSEGAPEARSNGYSLETNVAYLHALAHLKRVRR